MTRTGADLSHHQSSFDATAYAASGEAFIILKATEGASFVDPTFASRWRTVGSIGLARGAYAFARPGTATVDAQADHFLAVVRAAGWQAGDAWALDLEDAGGLGPASLLAWAERWTGRVRAALGGRGAFYSGVAFVFGALGDPGRIPGGCVGWVARYRSDTPWAAPWRRPRGWPEIPDVWQCTNGETGCVRDVAGVGRCDWNKATDSAFAALFGGREEADVPLSDEEVDRVADRVATRLGLRDGTRVADAKDVALVLRGDDVHPDSLKSLRAAVDGLGLGLSDAQLDALIAGISAKVAITGHPPYVVDGPVVLRPSE